MAGFIEPADAADMLTKLRKDPGPFEIKFRKANGAARVMKCAALGAIPSSCRKWVRAACDDVTWTVVDSRADAWRCVRVDSIYTIARTPPS
jgi:hypothetical protein